MQCNTKRDFAIKIKYFKMNNMPQSVADNKTTNYKYIGVES